MGQVDEPRRVDLGAEPANHHGISGVRVTTLPVLTPEPIPPPLPAADVDTFVDAMRKTIVRVLMSPKAQEALEDALSKATDLRERRLWFQLAAEIAMQKGKDAGEGGGVRITFNQQVPQPPHEDGPLRGKVVDISPGAR